MAGLVRIIIAAILLVPSAGAGADRATLAEIVRGAEILRRSSAAMAGSNDPFDLESLSFSYAGPVAFLDQGTGIDRPATFDFLQSAAIWFEPLRMRTTTRFEGGETRFGDTSYIDGSDPSAAGELARTLRNSPHAVIAHLLRQPRHVLLSGGTSTHYVLTAPFHGNLIHLHIDRKDLLLDRLVRAIDDVRHGDALSVTEFSDYVERDGWLVPRRIRVTEAGRDVIDLAYAAYAVNGVDPAALVEPEQAGGSTSNDAVSPAQRPSGSVELAEGVTLLIDTGGFDYHSLLVEGESGSLLIEVPGRMADGRTTLARAREASAGPIRLVAATHHHGDHSGGIPGALFDGAELVVAHSERPFFEDMIAAPRCFAIEAFSPAADVRITPVPSGGEIEMLDKVVAIDGGPSGHSGAHLIYYVPDAKLLFQSDMAVFRWDGSVEPARAQTCRLRKLIAERDLDVEIIAGGHGQPGSPADLDAAIALREGGCDDPSA